MKYQTSERLHCLPRLLFQSKIYAANDCLFHKEKTIVSRHPRDVKVKEKNGRIPELMHVSGVSTCNRTSMTTKCKQTNGTEITEKTLRGMQCEVHYYKQETELKTKTLKTKKNKVGIGLRDLKQGSKQCDYK